MLTNANFIFCHRQQLDRGVSTAWNLETALRFHVITRTFSLCFPVEQSLFCVFPESLVCLEMFCKDVMELSEELYKNSVHVLESSTTILPDPDQDWWIINLPEWMQYISRVLPALEDTIIKIRNITHQFLEYFKTTTIACSLKSHPDIGYYVSDYSFKEAYMKKVWHL